MHILVLGGTGFLGRHMVERALGRDWDVTLFNRGQRNPGLYPAATEIHGDRTKGFEALDGLNFDSVIDTSGYFPRDVEASTRFFRDRAPHYVFISTVSTYGDVNAEEITEETPVAPWNPDFEFLETVEPGAYGALKAECERRARRVYGEGALVLRPGLIVGRYDPTGRFSYWPQRFRRGGKIVVPENGAARIQVIDARDLADWTLDLCARRAGGLFNAAGPREPFTFQDLYGLLLPLAPPGTELVPLSNAFLLSHDVAPWTGLPLWLPKEGRDGMEHVNLEKSLTAGLKHRPLKDTVAGILAEMDETGTFAAGNSLTAEQEAALLAAR
jgi:2'-hydroxyisoflavone reductase